MPDVKAIAKALNCDVDVITNVTVDPSPANPDRPLMVTFRSGMQINVAEPPPPPPPPPPKPKPRKTKKASA